MQKILLILLLLLAGCGSAPKEEAPSGVPARVQRQTDQGCMSDCMGNGGQREFCKDRCTN